MEILNSLINNNWFIAALCLISPPLWKIGHDLIVKQKENSLNRSLHTHNTAFSKIYAQQFDIYIELYRKIDLMNDEYNALKKFRKDDEDLTRALALLQQTHKEAYKYYKENRIFFSNRIDSNLNIFFININGVFLLQETFINNRERAQKILDIKRTTDKLNFHFVPQSLCESPLEDLKEPIDDFSFDSTLSALKNEFRNILHMK